MHKRAMIGVFVSLLAAATSSGAIEDGLTAYWNFDEGAGSQARDRAPGTVADHLTLAGTPTWVTGKYGTAALFGTSATSYAQAANSADLIPAGGVISISLWVNLSIPVTSQTAQNNLATLIDGDNGYWLSFNMPFSSALAFRCVKAGSLNGASWAAGALTTGQWHHIVAVNDGQNIALYVDALQVASLSAPNSLGVSPANFLAGLNLQGAIDDLAIWNRALSVCEIACLTCGEIRIPEPATLAMLAAGGLSMLARRRRRMTPADAQ